MKYFSSVSVLVSVLVLNVVLIIGTLLGIMKEHSGFIDRHSFSQLALFSAFLILSIVFLGLRVVSLNRELKDKEKSPSVKIIIIGFVSEIVLVVFLIGELPFRADIAVIIMILVIGFYNFITSVNFSKEISQSVPTKRSFS